LRRAAHPSVVWRERWPMAGVACAALVSSNWYYGRNPAVTVANAVKGRPMRFLKSVVIVAAALAATAGTTIVASAYPPPKEHHSIDCDPGHVSANDGTCSVVFVDMEPSTTTTTTTAAVASLEGKAGQTVCFTVDGPGRVTPACSTTNSKGKAFATYHAGDSVKCSGKDPDGTNAVIRGKEHADDNGSAQTTVRVTCPDKDTKPHNDSAVSTSGSSNGSTTGARNTAALLSTPTTSPGSLALGGGILALIVIMSVAITGRLRLRGLRR
jgi:hypothetical protein